MADCVLKKIGSNLLCESYIKPKKTSMGIQECGFCKQPTEFRCIEDIKNYLPRMSQGSRLDYLSCRMKYFYNQVIGIKLRKTKLSEPVKSGIIWDKFIQLKYSNQSGIKNTIFKMFAEYDLSMIAQCKILALIKAFFDLEIKVDTENLISCQQEFNYNINDKLVVTGKVDLSYTDHFKEVKLSGSPDFYSRIHGIENQCSTYFLSNPDYEYCDIMITRFPKQFHQEKKGETWDAYKNRVYLDILSRPGNYFIKYDRKNKTYGMRFWRTEFDIKLIKKIDSILSNEIRACIDSDLWFKNKLACYTPAPCQYLHICDSGCISDMMYKDKEKI